MTRTTKANKSTSICVQEFVVRHDTSCTIKMTRAHAETWGDDVVQVFFKNDDDGTEKITFFELDEFKDFLVCGSQFIKAFEDVPENAE